MWIDVSPNYEVSSGGHIRNKITGKVLAEFVGKDGYLRTQFDGKTRTVHRVVATAFIPASTGKDFVNHKDGNKRNNSVENLEWCTRGENMIHAYSHGLKKPPKGEANGRAKLSFEDVQFIKENYKKGMENMEQKRLRKDSTLHIKQYVPLSVARTGNEWCSLFDWIETLPYSWLITGKEDCSDE